MPASIPTVFAQLVLLNLVNKLPKMKEMMEKPSHCDQQGNGGSFEVNTAIKKVANRDTLRLLPKLNFIGQSRTRTLNPSAEHKFNILLQVDSKNGIPTTAEIMESTIGYAIKNAKTLGLTKSEFLEKIESKFDETETIKRN